MLVKREPGAGSCGPQRSEGEEGNPRDRLRHATGRNTLALRPSCSQEPAGGDHTPPATDLHPLAALPRAGATQGVLSAPHPPPLRHPPPTPHTGRSQEPHAWHRGCHRRDNVFSPRSSEGHSGHSPPHTQAKHVPPHTLQMKPKRPVKRFRGRFPNAQGGPGTGTRLPAPGAAPPRAEGPPGFYLPGDKQRGSAAAEGEAIPVKKHLSPPYPSPPTPFPGRPEPSAGGRSWMGRPRRRRGRRRRGAARPAAASACSPRQRRGSPAAESAGSPVGPHARPGNTRHPEESGGMYRELMQGGTAGCAWSPSGYGSAHAGHPSSALRAHRVEVGRAVCARVGLYLCVHPCAQVYTGAYIRVCTYTNTRRSSQVHSKYIRSDVALCVFACAFVQSRVDICDCECAELDASPWYFGCLSIYAPPRTPMFTCALSCRFSTSAGPQRTLKLGEAHNQVRLVTPVGPEMTHHYPEQEQPPS